MNFFEYHVELVKALAWPVTVLTVAFVFRTDATALLKRIVKGKLGGAELEFERSMEGLASRAPEVAESAVQSEALKDATGKDAAAKEPPRADAAMNESDGGRHAPAPAPDEEKNVSVSQEFPWVEPANPASSGLALSQKKIRRAAAAVAANSNPRGAILEAWLEIEAAIQDLAQRWDLFGRRRPPPAEMMWRHVATSNILPSTVADMIADLRRQRNEAVHNRNFTPSPSAVKTYLDLVSLVVNIMDGVRPSATSSNSD